MARKSVTRKLQSARAAVDADNPAVSVDDVGIQHGSPRTIGKRRAEPEPAPRRGRPPRVEQPRADWEPQSPRRTMNDPDLEARAAKVGVGHRAPPRATPTVRREVPRDPHTGRVVIERGGKIYTRRSTAVGDKFHIDPADIPDGMSYQWIAITVAGAEQRNSIAQFQQNGWEAVPMSRYPGRYGPANHQGKLNNDPIVIDGLMLCERPIELTIEAREEEIGSAKELIRTRNDQFVPRMPEARARRGTELRAKRTIEGMPPDIGRPAYEVDVDQGLL